MPVGGEGGVSGSVPAQKLWGDVCDICLFSSCFWRSALQWEWSVLWQNTCHSIQATFNEFSLAQNEWGRKLGIEGEKERENIRKEGKERKAFQKWKIKNGYYSFPRQKVNHPEISTALLNKRSHVLFWDNMTLWTEGNELKRQAAKADSSGSPPLYPDVLLSESHEKGTPVGFSRHLWSLCAERATLPRNVEGNETIPNVTEMK